MNSHHQILGANQMQQHNHTMNTNNMNNNSNNNQQHLNTMDMAPHYHDMKSSISSYSLNQPPQYSTVASPLPPTNTNTTNASSMNMNNSTLSSPIHRQQTSKMYNPSPIVDFHTNNTSTNTYHSHHLYPSSSPSLTNNAASYPVQASTNSYATNTISSSSSTYPSANSGSTSSMLVQNSPYQQTYYTSSSSFQSNPQHHHYAQQTQPQHQQQQQQQQAHAPTSRHSPINNRYATGGVQSNSSIHAPWSSQDKLPNVKDIFGSPIVANTWSSSKQSSQQERLPSLIEGAKRSESVAYNNYNQHVISHSQAAAVPITTTHVVTNNSTPTPENMASTLMEELQHKLKQQEAAIQRLEKENVRLRNELDSFNRITSTTTISNSNTNIYSGNNVKGSPVKKRKVSSDNVAGGLEMKSQTSHSSSSDQFSNSNEGMSDAFDEDDEEDEEDGKSKKRKQPSNMSRSKKPKDESKKQKSSRSSGRRDATVGDLAKYTVTWKGENYVLVNAFKNRTQILNYYVPLYQNNFPEKTCKLVLCNDEYKILSSENPNTVDKKKHAWRVSVFTMDFYNFVKNFDKKTLKIINSSSGFIPNVNFEGPISPHSVSSPSNGRISNNNLHNIHSPSSASTSTPTSVVDNRRPSLPNSQPTLLAPLNGLFSDATLNMSPKPISTIHNK